jgi:ATP-dependent Lon protease
MKESVEAARTVVRSRSRALGIKDEVFEKKDMHIHVPGRRDAQGRPERRARDDDGLVSAMTGHPGARRRRDDRRDHAARRGHGDRRPEGKAARRPARRHQDGADPGENAKDLQDIPENVKNDLEIVPVSGSTRCLESRSERLPAPLVEEEPQSPAAGGAGAKPVAVQH